MRPYVSLLIKPVRVLATLGCLWVAQGSVYAAVPVEQRVVGDQVHSRSTQDAFGYNAQEQYGSNSTGSAQASSSDPLWEIVNQLQMLQTEVLELRGVIDQQAYEIQQLQKQQKQHYIDLDQRIEALNGSSGGVSPTAGRPVSNSGPQTAQQPEDPEAVKASYQQALGAIKDRNYAGAESQLRLILAGSESFYTPFAHYWLGEVLLAKKVRDLQGARSSFERVIQQYDGHSKIPPSLYKLGTILHVEGDVAKAKATLKRLIDAFPGSAEAGMASHYLDQI